VGILVIHRREDVNESVRSPDTLLVVGLLWGTPLGCSTTGEHGTRIAFPDLLVSGRDRAPVSRRVRQQRSKADLLVEIGFDGSSLCQHCLGNAGPGFSA
jgi:hypothetical protein